MSLNGIKEILLASNPGSGINPAVGYIYKWVEQSGSDYIYKYKDSDGTVGAIGTTVIANFFNPIKTVTADYQCLLTDRNILADTASNDVTVMLPTSKVNLYYVVKKIDQDNTLTIKGYGSSTIDESTEVTLTNKYDSITFLCDGSNWWVV